MIKIITLMAVLCFFINVSAQSTKPHRIKAGRIEKKQPSIFITYERAGEREPLRASESSKGVWLRLHNNTKWKITFPAFGVPEELGEVGMFYRLEVTDSAKYLGYSESLEPPVGYPLAHLYSIVELPPRDSVLFSIPREHIVGGLALRISFNYEWENTGDVLASREPTHYVYFYSSSIPQEVQRIGERSIKK